MEVIYVDISNDKVILNTQDNHIPREKETVWLIGTADISAEIRPYYVHQVSHSIIVNPKQSLSHTVIVYLKR